ncbi:hypothetical protein DXG01_003159 [Tephrocybe rancida]|nr:hypothetical protein DXG01_003159 [Tephrocybe rancida]
MSGRGYTEGIKGYLTGNKYPPSAQQKPPKSVDFVSQYTHELAPGTILPKDPAPTLEFSDDDTYTVPKDPGVGLELSDDDDGAAHRKLSEDKQNVPAEILSHNDPSAGMELSDDEDVSFGMELSDDEDVAAGMELSDSN